MAFFLGIDGGATKATCLVGDEAHVLGSSRAGGCNLVRSAEDVARKNLHIAIREACQAAHISPEQIARACLGAAGITATGVPDKLKAMLAELIPGCIEIVSDMDIALEAAFGRGPGVVVNAGTGSIAIGRNKNGKTARVGGWGYAISDEGSGNWIGREAVRRALHTWDLECPGALPGMVRQAWKIQTRDDVVRMANACPPPPFPELFPVVLKAANEGDTDARGILEDAGAELAVLAHEAVRRLRSAEERDIPVAIIGGVFNRSQLVRERFRAILGEAGITHVIPDVVDPAIGALARARNAAL